MLNTIKEIVETTKPDGITRKLKATKYWTVIDNWSNISGKGTEKIFLYINQIQQPVCACGSNKPPKFISIKKGYNEFCSNKCSAASKAQTERRKTTMVERYGGIGLGGKSIKEKQEKTLKEKYNITNPGQLQTHKDNMKLNNPMHDPKVKQKLEDFYKKKYGVENNSQKNWSEIGYKILKSKKILKEYYDTKSIAEIATICNVWESTVLRYLSKYNIRIANENIAETQIQNFLTEKNIKFQQNTRKIIPPYELDFYLPEENLAIEYCGLYWHSEIFKQDKEYHLRKYNLCKEKNIRLITIFEDEWLEKQTIVKKIIINAVNQSNKPIYARNCTISIISNSKEKEFSNLHHIQGSSGSTISYGLFKDNQLLATMAFIKQSNIWTLNRFTIGDNNIVGGASKLFKYFVKHNNPNTVISFSDNRWFSGDLYPILGFKDKSTVSVDYSYVKSQKRYHKFNFRKNKIAKKFNIDVSSGTEKEFMKELGYARIWDCGKLKWVWNKS